MYDFNSFDEAVKPQAGMPVPPKNGKKYDFSAFDNVVKKNIGTTSSNGVGTVDSQLGELKNNSKDADLYKNDPEAYFAKWGLHPMKLEQSKDPLNDALVVANEKLNIARSETDPIARLQKTKQATQEISKVKSGFNGDGTIAKPILDNLIGDNTEKYSDEQLQQKTPNTLTGQKALQSVLDQRKVQNAIATTSDLERAATKYASGIEGEPQGKDIQPFLNNPNVIALTKQDPNIARQYKETQFNFYNHFPDEAKKDIEQKIGQHLEDKGETNFVYNNPGKEKVDNAVDEMVKNGDMNQHEKYIYNKNIRSDLGTLKSYWSGSPIPTADVVNTLSQSLKKSGGDVASSIRDVTDKLTGGTISALGESPEARTQRLQQEEQLTPQVEPKGELKKTVLGATNFLGFATPLILGEIAGIPTYATMVAQFEGENADKSRELFPKDQVKQNLYTLLGTTIDATFGELGLPTKEAGGALRNMLSKEVKGTIEDYAAKKITSDEAEQAIYGKVNDFAQTLGTGALKGGSTVTAYQLLHNGLDAAFGKRDFNVGEQAKEALGNLPQNIANMAFVSGIAASGKLLGEEHPEAKISEAQPTEDQVQPQNKIVPNSENIVPDNSLRTMDMGSKEGQKVTEADKKSLQTNFLKGDVPIDGENGKGETGRQFAGRVISRFENVKQTEPNNTSLVTHSSTLKAIKAWEDPDTWKGIEKPTDPNNMNDEQWQHYAEAFNKESTENGDLETFKGNNGDINVIRHGETEDNKENKFRSGNTNLTDKGINQAHEVGKELNQKTGGEVPKIISSNLPRAIHSSNIINEELGEKEKPETKSTSVILPDENKKPNIIPLKTETKEPTETEPIKKVKSPASTNTEVQQEEGGGNRKVGVSHASLTDLANKLKLKEPERGEYTSPMEYADRGRQLLKAGANPEDVNNPNNELHDRISVARAHLEDLVKADNDAGDKFGENSKQYNDAHKELNDYSEKVKKLGTAAHRAFTSLQGERDIDTGSFTAIKAAKSEATGKPVTTLPSDVQELSKKVKNLQEQNDKLSQQLKEHLDKSTDEAKLTFTEKAKKVADRFRKLKSNPFTFKDENGKDVPIQKMGIGWNDLVEVGAKAIEQTGKIADGIKAVIDKIKDEDWYKKLSDNDKDRFSQQLKEHYGEDDILTRFTDKKDNKFSPEDTKDIWAYAKENYINDNPNFKVADMVNKVAMELGLKPEQVRNALAQTSQTKRITDQIYRNQYEKNRAHKTIQQWVNKGKESPVDNFLNTVAAPFRGLATLGHGHALLFTHAGMNLFDPRISLKFLKASAQQFKLVYGKAENYEKAVNDLKNDPLYTTAVRSGLAVNPDTIYDDWQIANNFLKRLKIQGNKGFLVLKQMRMEIFKNEVNHLTAIEKADPEALKNAAQNANHWTGTAGLKVSSAANAFIFAPNLIVSKFARLTTDPAKALITLKNWNKASVADKAAAKIILKKSGRIAATYLAALAGNQALLWASGSNQSVNFSNPFKSDWLKFKAGDKTIDVTSGMQSTLQFMTQLGALPLEDKKDVKKDYYGAASAGDALNNLVAGYARRVASPLGSTVWDVASHKDFQGNVLPMYSDKPRAGRVKLTPFDYFMEKAPIPLSEGYRTFQDQMKQEGVPDNKAKAILNGLIVGAVGSAGIKVGNEPKERPTPFTEEDKKDPVFKYFSKDWGMELPNTVASSETITDEDKGTKKKLSDYPKDIQDKYMTTHKGFLKDILSDIKDNGTVYVKNYEDAQGNPKNEVSLSRPKSGEYDEKELNKLSTDEKAQVLHLAQAQATGRTKKELFNQ